MIIFADFFSAAANKKALLHIKVHVLSLNSSFASPIVASLLGSLLLTIKRLLKLGSTRSSAELITYYLMLALNVKHNLCLTPSLLLDPIDSILFLQPCLLWHALIVLWKDNLDL